MKLEEMKTLAKDKGFKYVTIPVRPSLKWILPVGMGIFPEEW